MPQPSEELILELRDHLTFLPSNQVDGNLDYYCFNNQGIAYLRFLEYQVWLQAVRIKNCQLILRRRGQNGN